MHIEIIEYTYYFTIEIIFQWLMIISVLQSDHLAFQTNYCFIGLILCF